MNTNIVISLDTRREKQDGTYPLIMRLGHKRKTIPIPLGYSIKKKDWDEEQRIVKKSHIGSETVTRLNNIIQTKRNEAMDEILKLQQAKQLDTLTITELKDRIFQPASAHSFFKFAEKVVEDLEKAQRFGTARSYESVAGIIKSYNHDKDLSFEDITYDFLMKFETDHFAKGNGKNGLATYMRSIRAIYNKAIKAGIITKEQYPFDNYKIKTEPTEKRALEWNILEKIIAHKIGVGEPFFNERNFFVASYMMYGMNFLDMAFLKKSDRKEDRIKYRRSKTSKLYDIKISPALKEILDYYEAKSASAYIFPIVKRTDPKLMENDVLWARNRYNKRLKALAKQLKIKENLTSYVSRHSFATQAMLKEVPLVAISTMLGHSSLKTTQVYLKSLPSNILDEYNSRILAG